MEIEKDFEQDEVELVNQILQYKREKCPDFNLMDTILSFTHAYNLNIENIGHILVDNQSFMNVFNKDLEKNKYIKNLK